MNATTQTQAGTGYFNRLKQWVEDLSYQYLGLGMTIPIPGATGMKIWIGKADQSTASKSKRIMRMQRGSQPESIGERRLAKNQSRALKASNRYCNNIDKNGTVICN